MLHAKLSYPMAVEERHTSPEFLDDFDDFNEALEVQPDPETPPHCGQEFSSALRECPCRETSRLSYPMLSETSKFIVGCQLLEDLDE